MPGDKFHTLTQIMATLRAPGGCPWDREQSIESLRQYLIEETYEVLDAIERRDWKHLPEELGDLQLQIVFQSQIAAEEGLFSIGDVLEAITQKLIRRHPHVFAHESIETADGVERRWDQIKAEEKASANPGHTPDSILDDVPPHQPGLLEAHKLTQRAAKVGFDWRHFDELLQKLEEEAGELREAKAASDPGRLEDELGDLLFMVVNIARHLDVNPELALKRTNRKFRQRFGHIERTLQAQGRKLEDATLEEMEELWQAAKTA